MKKLVVVVFPMVLLIAVFLVLGSKRPWTTRPSESLGRTDQTITTAKRYAILPAEIERLAHQAEGGGCQAAERLGAYYMNYELSYVKAVKWYRLAAKCPDVAPKEQLIILLYQVKRVPEVEYEVDRLILDIRATDPARAKVIAENVEVTRHENTVGSGGAH